MNLFASGVVFALIILSLGISVSFELDNVSAGCLNHQNRNCDNMDSEEKMANFTSIFELPTVSDEGCQKTEYSIPIIINCIIGDNAVDIEEIANTHNNQPSSIPFLLPFP